MEFFWFQCYVNLCGQNTDIIHFLPNFQSRDRAKISSLTLFCPWYAYLLWKTLEFSYISIGGWAKSEFLKLYTRLVKKKSILPDQHLFYILHLIGEVPFPH